MSRRCITTSLAASACNLALHVLESGRGCTTIESVVECLGLVEMRHKSLPSVASFALQVPPYRTRAASHSWHVLIGHPARAVDAWPFTCWPQNAMREHTCPACPASTASRSRASSAIDSFQWPARLGMSKVCIRGLSNRPGSLQPDIALGHGTRLVLDTDSPGRRQRQPDRSRIPGPCQLPEVDAARSLIPTKLILTQRLTTTCMPEARFHQ